MHDFFMELDMYADNERRKELLCQKGGAAV